MTIHGDSSQPGSGGQDSSQRGTASSGMGNPDRRDEFVERALAFDRRLKELGASSPLPSSSGLEESRIGSVLKMLNATLRPDLTHSLGPADVGMLVDLPPMVGRFRVGRRIGRGSFGVVYLAHDTVLDRDVAVKAVPLRVDLPSLDDDYRLIEARAAAKLNHPNLVPLYEVLEDDQCLLLVSEFCDGPNLAEYLRTDGVSMPVAWAADVTLQLAQAVAHAHARGFIHRDIKPGNVLLSPETAAGDLLPFTPRLTDFGLVLDTDNDLDCQANHRLAGTILYMAPEQILGDRRYDAKLGDVYALGLILYQMLAGRLPYRASSTVDLIAELCDESIQPISSRDKPIPPDLHAIYMKALCKDPDHRYQSAQELMEDLARFRDGREVIARPRSRVERVVRAMRGEPLVASLIGTLICFAIASFAIIGWNNRQLRWQGNSLAAALAAASDSKREAVEVAFRSDMQKAFRANLEGDTATAWATIRDIERYTQGDANERYDFKLITSLVSDGWFHVDRFKHAVTEISLVPGTDRFVVASEGEQIGVYRDNGDLLDRIHVDPGHGVHGLAVSPDGRWIAAGMTLSKRTWWFGGVGSVKFFSLADDLAVPGDITDHDRRHPLHGRVLDGFRTTIESIAFTPNGRRLAVGSRYEVIDLFDLDDPTWRSTVNSDRRLADLSFTPQGQLLCNSARSDAVLHTIDGDRSAEEVLSLFDDSVRSLACSPDGNWVAMTLIDSDMIHMVDRSDPSRREYQLQSKLDAISRLQFCSRGQSLLAGTRGGGIAIWDLDDVSRTGPGDQPIPPNQHQTIHGSCVTAIARNDNGSIISGAHDGSVIVWKTGVGDPLSQATGAAKPIYRAAVTPDGSAAVTTNLDGSVERLDLSTGRRQLLRHGGEEQCINVACSDDGCWAAVGCHSGEILVGRTDQACDVDTGLAKSGNDKSGDRANGDGESCDGERCDEERCDEERCDGERCDGERCDGESCLIADDRGWIKLPPPTNPAPRFWLPPHLVFMPSGKQLCVVRAEYDVDWFDLKFSPDGRSLVGADLISSFRASSSIEAVARIDAQTVMLIGDSIGFTRPGCSYPSDQKTGSQWYKSSFVDRERSLVYVGCIDGRIRVLNFDGELVAQSERWNEALDSRRSIREITSITVSPDGLNLITGSSTSEIAIWDATTLRMLGVVSEGVAGQSVTQISVSPDGNALTAHLEENDLDGPFNKGRLKIFRTKPLANVSAVSDADEF